MATNQPGSNPANNQQFPNPGRQEPFVNEALSKEFFIGQARYLRMTKGWGRDRIWNYLDKGWGGEGFDYAVRTVANWYKGIEPSKSLPFDPETYAAEDAPYLARLDLLKRSLYHPERLTVAEAEVAVRLKHFFNSPEGESVDLFPQLAVIDAYNRTTIADLSLDALNDMLAYQPWNSDGEGIYRYALEKHLAEVPYIPLLTESTNVARESFEPAGYIVGAFAQLRIPMVTYYDKTAGRFRVSFLSVESVNNPWNPVDGAGDVEKDEFGARLYKTLGEYASQCNWRVLIAGSLAGVFKPVTVYTVSIEEASDGNR